MLKFVTFAVKVQLNAHDLNNETTAGNVMDIRMMEFLDEKGQKVEAPAVSGRMLKHWHYEAMRKLILHSEYTSIPLCDGCRVGEPIRPGEKRGDRLVQVSRAEPEALTSCAICDIHGYLIARSGEGGDRGTSARRASRVMFSWLMPVLGTESTQKQVLHTRVSRQEATDENEQSAQMLFYKSYASGIYGFVSALDVERIGLVELLLASENPYVIEENERKERIKVALEAYRYMISGQMGASLSHALPHMNPIEILVCYSETGPLPFPVSPMYPDYLSKTIGLAPSGAKFLYWGSNPVEGVEVKETINELFEELLSKV